MRIPFIAGAAMLALVACQKTADSNQNIAVSNDTTATADMNAPTDMGGNAMGGANTSKTADTAFLTDALKGDNGEIAIGKLAATQGMSQATKNFGTMLATDHGAHKDKVAALLSSAGGTPTDEASEEGKANLAKLKALKGAEFDKAFKAAMIEDHNKDIAKFTKQAASSDSVTAQLAKDTLPTLEKHLRTAKSL